MNSFEKDWKKLEKVIRQRQGKESGIKNVVVACEPPILVLDRCSDYKQCRFNLTVARYATAAAAHQSPARRDLCGEGGQVLSPGRVGEERNLWPKWTCSPP